MAAAMDERGHEPHADWWRLALDTDGEATQPTVDDGLASVADWQAAQLRVLQDLGRSGQVQVRRCVQSPLGRRVLVLEAPQDAAALLAIGRGLAGIRHPGIQRIHDGGDGLLVCADIEGETLATAWERGAMSLGQAVSALAEVAEALAHVHACGLLHRDVKPTVIQIGRYGEVVLTGWGCAVANPLCADGPQNAPNLEGQRLVMGSPAWMAPEQARGAVAQIGPAVDVFALGACLYFLLYRQPLHAGTAAEALRSAAQASFTLPPLVDPAAAALRQVALSLLAVDPQQRPSCAEAAQALRSWVQRSARLQAFAQVMAEQPADVLSALAALQQMDAYRDCWQFFRGVTEFRAALVHTIIDGAVAEGDVDFAHDFAASCDQQLVSAPLARRMGEALARQRGRQRLRRWSGRAGVAAIVCMALAFSLTAWLQITHSERLYEQRRLRALQLSEQVEQELATAPGDAGTWQEVLRRAWQAHGLAPDETVVGTLVDRSSSRAMAWALANGDSTLALAWGLAHRELRGSKAVAELLIAAQAAGSDRQQRLNELDGDVAALRANPFLHWQAHWWSDLGHRLAELHDGELEQRLNDLSATDAIPLLRLHAHFAAARPGAVDSSTLHQLMSHDHPAVREEAWLAAARREDDQALRLLVASIDSEADLLEASRLAEHLGPWALRRAADWSDTRQGALLQLILSGGVEAFLDAGRAQATPESWPLYGQLAWASNDLSALGDWLARGTQEQRAAWGSILGVLEGNPAQSPWEHLFAHRLQPQRQVPPMLVGAVADGDLGVWRGCLPYAAAILAQHQETDAAQIAGARARTAVAPWDHLIERARQQHRTDRLTALMALRAVWYITAPVQGDSL